MEVEIDYEADGRREVGEDKLEALRDHYRNYIKLAIEAIELEDKLKAKKDEMHRIQHNAIPDILTEIGMDELKMADGMIISKERWLSASIPSESQINKQKDPDKLCEMIERRKEGLKWLGENNGGAIIKNLVVVDLGKDSIDEAGEFLELAAKNGVYATAEQSVHSATLASFMKEKRVLGVDIPEDTFKLSHGVKAKFKKGKKA